MVDLKEVKELIRCLEESKLRKLIFKKGDLEIHLEKEEAPPPKLPLAESRVEPIHHAEHPVKGGRREEASGTYVTSPMVGTFYASPAPDEPSFVKVGERVTEDTVVCIIEAMKVMNEVKAGVRGVVAEILADHAQPVEFGTRLLRIT